MAKAKFGRTKPHCNIDTIGHVDHGKTSLTATNTKVLAETGGATFVEYANIDKAPEERERGITISTAHVEYETASRHYAHVDCPSHADYVKNMITGAAQMDGAILVISASDGPMPHPRAHPTRSPGRRAPDCRLHQQGRPSRLSRARRTRDPLIAYGYDGDNIPVITGSTLTALEGKSPEASQKFSTGRTPEPH